MAWPTAQACKGLTTKTHYYSEVWKSFLGRYMGSSRKRNLWSSSCTLTSSERPSARKTMKHMVCAKKCLKWQPELWTFIYYFHQYVSKKTLQDSRLVAPTKLTFLPFIVQQLRISIFFECVRVHLPHCRNALPTLSWIAGYVTESFKTKN